MKHPLKINSSIYDFSPVLSTFEPLFEGLSHAGFDGVELIMGIKSRWSIDTLKKLSRKYSLPVVTVHQPMWSGVGLWLDEGFFKASKRLEAKGIVIHPKQSILRRSDDDSYLAQLAKWGRKYELGLFLENMPPAWTSPVLDRLFPFNPYTASLTKLAETCSRHGVKINFDTSHARINKPYEDEEFIKIFPQIGNIHLSSYKSRKDHLSLTQGDFDSKGFVKFLENNNYQGFLDFEIFHPNILKIRNYDFNPLKESIDLLRR